MPKSYSQASTQDCRRQALSEKLQALLDNHIWDIITCPLGVKPLRCKWIYTIKLRAHGSIKRYKARLVALENRQEYGFDYKETFAPLAKMTTVFTVIAIASSKG